MTPLTAKRGTLEYASQINRRWRERTNADPVLRERARLKRRIKYLADKKRKLGYEGDITIAALYEAVKGRWVLRDIYIDRQAAQGVVSREQGLRWVTDRRGFGYDGYELGNGLKWRVTVKSISEWKAIVGEIGK